jgi:cobalt-zinc-cadmium efflux system outer membrane protein
MLALLALAISLAIAGAPAPLTLADALAQARASSPLRSAPRHLAEGTSEAARLAGRLPNPLFDLRVENVSTVQSSVLPRDVFAVVGQPIEMGGKRGLRAGVAAADRDVAAANLQTADWQIASQTTQIYVRALKARGVLETLEASRESLAGLMTAMRRRVEEGYAAEADLLKFETESARLDVDLAGAGLALARSLKELTYVIGAPTPIDAAQLVEPPPMPPPSAATGGIAAAIERHPEIAAATARVARAGQAVALERARRIPDAMVTAGYKRTNGFATAVAGLSFTLPLFDRNSSAAARAAGEAHAAAADREALTARLASDAASLIAAAQVLADRSARAERELLAPADAVRNAARASFREGRTDVLRLLDAERVYGDVRLAMLELRLDALAASLEARFALSQEIAP